MPHGTLNVGEFKGYANGFEHKFSDFCEKSPDRRNLQTLLDPGMSYAGANRPPLFEARMGRMVDATSFGYFTASLIAIGAWLSGACLQYLLIGLREQNDRTQLPRSVSDCHWTTSAPVTPHSPVCNSCR